MFHFPEPGELSNPSGIPISEDDAYWLLLVNAPMLVALGESSDTSDPLNPPLLAWWNLMNALPRDLRILCQKIVRAGCAGQLPASPWEDVAPDGTPLS
jgi:hypothetical protein